jgi:hypothetical protein
VRHRPALRLPLENHNYLRRVAYDLADQADRKNETARNRAERTGDRRVATDGTGDRRVAPTSDRRAAPDGTGDRPVAPSVLSPEQVREQVAAIKSRIGRRMP